jgi:chromosomal replication initiation ATPase DnaA
MRERARKDAERGRLAAAMAASALGTSLDEVLNGNRGMKVMFTRQVALYLAAAGFGMSYGRAAAAFGCDPSTVAHACRVIEAKRDEPAFDRWLDTLEAAAVSAPVLS